MAVSSKLLLKYSETLEQYGTGLGVLSALPWTLTLENQANQEFVSLYQQAYEEPPISHSMRAYDTGRLLIKALAKLQGKWDGLQVVQQMKTLPVISPRHGEELLFDSHGEVVAPAYIFKTKQEGDRLVNEMIGQVPPVNMDDYQK